MNINVDIELREIENFIRDNIQFALKNKYGNEWDKHLGVTERRMNDWKERMENEKKRLNGKNLDDRILYYSDFYDLKTIIEENWDTVFMNVFHDKKKLTYMLDTLEAFRNPNAHNRDLLEHQNHLLVGIAGELKLDMMEYRGDKEKMESYFPEIDSIQINSESFIGPNAVSLKKIYRIGDTLEIVIYVSCPPNQKLLYKFGDNGQWSTSNKFILKIDKAGTVVYYVYIKSNSKHHRLDHDLDILKTIIFNAIPNE